MADGDTTVEGATTTPGLKGITADSRPRPRWFEPVRNLACRIEDSLEQTLVPRELVPYAVELDTLCRRLIEVGDLGVGGSPSEAAALAHEAEPLLAGLNEMSKLIRQAHEGVEPQDSDARLRKLAGSFPQLADNFRVHAMHILFDDVVRLPSQVARLEKGLEAATKQLQDLVLRPTDVMKEMEEAAIATRAARMQAEKLLEESRDKLQAVLAEAGVGKFAEHFDRLEVHHNTEAVRWLGNAKTFALMAAGVVGVFMLVLVVDAFVTWNIGLELGIAFGTLLSIAASITVFCARNYRAHEHNASVNKHRAVSLQTFVAFRDSTTDEPTKNAVLALAAQCAFTGQDTGFGGGVEVVTPVVQALKAKP